MNNLSTSQNFNNYFSICMNFKDEAIYLKDWVEYHLSIGVDHFYLYNNESSDNFLEILKPYQEKGLVTLNNIPGSGVKRKVSKHFLNNYKSETFWVAFIDSDEYITFVEDQETVQNFFKDFEEFPGVGLNWLMFGSSGLSGIQTPVSEKFTMCAPPYDAANLLENPNLVSAVCTHIKSVINPRKVTGNWYNPHFYQYKNESSKKSKIPSLAVNTEKKEIPAMKAATSRENTKHDKAFIRHYFVNTKEEFFRRRANRLRDDVANAGWFPNEEVALQQFKNYEGAYNRVKYEDVLAELKKLKNK